MNFLDRIFGKKEEIVIEPPSPPVWLAKWKEVCRQYPIGRKFEYLSRELLVTKHNVRLKINDELIVFEIVTEYCDLNGKLREWHFQHDMADVLELDTL